MSYLDCAPRTEGGGRRRVDVVDQTLRDGPQSWWGMRLRRDMGLPIASELDRTGFHTIDLVGSSIFEVLVRHCHEDPWDQLISLSRAMPRTTVRAGSSWTSTSAVRAAGRSAAAQPSSRSRITTSAAAAAFW